MMDIPQKSNTNENLDISNLVQRAVSLHQDGRIQDALNEYEKILEIDDKNLTALNNISLLLKDKPAIELLKKALIINPKYSDALINICIRLLASNEIAEAGHHFKKLIDIYTHDQRIDSANRMTDTQKFLDLNYNQDSPRYSVIVPTHHRPHLLSRTLRSLRAQTDSDSLEIIVVSDCIDPLTEDVCRQWLTDKDTYIRRSGKPGPSASRNLALKIAKGQNILFLDDDDAWHPDLLENLNKSYESKLGKPAYFNCTIINERRANDNPKPLSSSTLDTSLILNENIYVKNQIPICCYMFPRQLLVDIQFDIHMRAYEDWDFVLSVLDREVPTHIPILGSIVYTVDDETTDRRGSSESAKDINAVIDYLYVYRRHSVREELAKRRTKFMSDVGFNLPWNALQ